MEVQRMAFESARLLIVHGGAAHRDDLLATCIVLALNPRIAVERRDPTPAELDDAGVMVVDVGRRYEPERGNFDHHFPDAAPTCALTLVLRALGLEDAARDFWPWLGFTEVMDSTGPTAAARHMGLDAGRLPELWSPVEWWLLRQFATVKRLGPDSPMAGQLAQIGRFLLEELHALSQRLDLLARTAVPTSVAGLAGLDLREVPAEVLQGTIEPYCRRQAPATVVFVTLNQRGPGWAIYRRNDHPAVDFRRIANHPAVSFVHPTGFMAIVDPSTDPWEVAALACAAPPSQ
jgi:hypothetical protein